MWLLNYKTKCVVKKKNKNLQMLYLNLDVITIMVLEKEKTFEFVEKAVCRYNK